MNNISVILNPKAGKGKALKFRSKLEKALSGQNLKYKIYVTKQRKHATEIVRDLAPETDLFIIMGGDGTLSEVINGINPDEQNIPKLLVLPLGSGNDFAKEINCRNKSKAILECLTAGNCIEKSVNLSTVNLLEPDGKKKVFQFVNALGIGFDSYVAYLNLENKVLSGIPSYVLAVFKGIRKYNPIEPTILIDGAPHSDSSGKLLVTVGNNKTSGGGFYLNPFAEIDDDILDITVIRHLSPMEIVKKLPKVLVNKTEKIPEFIHKNGKKISIALKHPFIVHADGEIFSEKAVNVDIELLEKRLIFLGANNV